jgi:type IV secretion system protein VirB3
MVELYLLSEYINTAPQFGAYLNYIEKVGYMSEGKVEADMLFLGLTRPPLLFGVSYTFALLNFMVCLLAFIITNKFMYFFAALPVHMLGYYLCSKEPLFLDLFLIRSSKCSRTKNKFFHGANSYDMY